MSAGRLILMGSGETAAPLVAAHRLGIEASGARRALVLDTPYGFQENVSLISAKLTDYFRTSLSIPAETACYRSAEAGAVAREQMLAATRRARYVFAGPGSPSYALAVWRDTGLASVLRNLLSGGATVTFASAAALTAGIETLPVYEIYKVGGALGWLDGLDLTSHLGLEAVFIPHWNNTEGKGFDTTRCYMGRRRFGVLRSMLPARSGVMGIDEHTAAVIDFGQGELRVMGIGGVTLCGEEETVLTSGETMGLGTVSELLESGSPQSPLPDPSPIVDMETAFHSRSGKEIARTLLDAESRAAGESGDARSQLRAMLLEVAEKAAKGLVEPVEWVGDYVDLLVEVRSDLRMGGRWEEADRIRSRLESLGVSLRDTPSGTRWTLGTFG